MAFFLLEVLCRNEDFERFFPPKSRVRLAVFPSIKKMKVDMTECDDYYKK